MTTHECFRLAKSIDGLLYEWNKRSTTSNRHSWLINAPFSNLIDRDHRSVSTSCAQENYRLSRGCPKVLSLRPKRPTLC